jgi:hypothetical protein
MNARTGLITVPAILLTLLRGRSYKHLHTLTGREYGACYTVLMPLRESIQLRDANARPDRAGVLARLTGCQTKNVSDFALGLLVLL